ncbi:hypothetical protein SUDANB95_05764 [Actinosynnema sp. ALI-1.44]
MPQSLDEALRSLFLKSASTATKALINKGVSTKVIASRSLVAHGGKSWSSEVERFQINVLQLDFNRLIQLSPLFDDAIRADLTTCGHLLASDFTVNEIHLQYGPGNLPPYFSELPVSTENADDGTRYAWQVVFPALRHHLMNLSAVDDADEADAEKFARDVLQFADAGTIRQRTTVALAGVTVDGNFTYTEDNATFILRALSPIEVGTVLDSVSPLMTLSGTLPSAALEVHETVGPQIVMGIEPLVEKRWMAAIRLAGHSIHPGRSTVSFSPDWIYASVGRLPLPLILRNTKRNTEVDRADFRTICNTYLKLRTLNLQRPNSTRSLAIHRFSLGMEREQDVDALLDYVIALEAVLLPYDPDTRHGDISYRFRIHGAYYLANDLGERREIFKQLQDLYTVRSALVHGGKYPDPNEITTAKEAAERLARAVLVKALAHGFPDAAKFKSMLLDG